MDGNSRRKVFYTSQEERELLIQQALEQGELLLEDAITIEGNYLIFAPREEAPVYQKPLSEIVAEQGARLADLEIMMADIILGGET